MSTVKEQLEAWASDPSNRRSYLLPLALRIHGENPLWPTVRVVVQAKVLGCSKTVARKINGVMEEVPNPDYMEPPLTDN